MSAELTGFSLPTIDFQEGRPSLAARLVTGRAGVQPTVTVANTGDDQHAAPPPHWGDHHPQVGPDVLTVEGPGDGERFISHHGNTTQLGKVALINNFLAEGEWDQLGRN